ncbi:MAG TPA: hypothetical protein VKU02_00690 [Gemmataceae bacterium]|nr:hypothetical protein [Gemmataceae bacterium]
MRASSLSDAKVISLLNRYFVPVFVSSEDDAHWGTGDPAEKAEYGRIYTEASKAGLSTGTVHVYILNPQGHPIDSLHVAQACQPEHLIPLLERAVQSLKPRPGAPVVKPGSLSAPPKHDADALVLHLTSRVVKPGSGWDKFPVENWIVLKRAQWTKFLPPRNLDSGKSWDIDKETASELLTYFYPATENNAVSTNRIEQEEMKGRILSQRDGLTRVRLWGKLKMQHNFYYKDDGNMVTANLIGFLDYDPQKKTIRSFEMTTDEASYARGTFAVAVRSVP